MAGALKAARKPGLDLHIATLQLKEFAAFVAPEVVMMLLASYFVATWAARDRDRRQPVVRQQRVDVAVDGGEAQAFYLLLSKLQCFFVRERPIRLGEGIANSVFLSSVSSLDHRLFPILEAHNRALKPPPAWCDSRSEYTCCSNHQANTAS